MQDSPFGMAGVLAATVCWAAAASTVSVEQVTSVKETKRCFLRLQSFWAEPVELLLFLAFSELAWER